MTGWVAAEEREEVKMSRVDGKGPWRGDELAPRHRVRVLRRLRRTICHRRSITAVSTASQSDSTR